jgi:four helix bundle protein
MNKEANENTDAKPYDLEERTFLFARKIRAFVKTLPPTIANKRDVRQLVDASGSVGANYREANEAITKKEFRYRAMICRKEAKEARYWLRLLDTGSDAAVESERDELRGEADELMKIFNSILNKSR